MSMLFTRNPDDFYSFGFHVLYSSPHHKAALSMGAFTLRGIKSVPADENVVKGRYDTLHLSYAYTFSPRLFQPDNSRLNIAIGAGLQMHGNLGLKKVQELWHLAQDLYTLSDVSYDPRLESIRTAPSLSAEITYIYPYHLPYSEKARLVTAPFIRAEYISSYGSIAEGGFEFFLDSYGEQLIGLGILYRYEQDATGWIERKSIVPHYTGLEYSLTFDSGFIFRKQNIMANEGISYGMLLFDVLSFTRPSTWEASNLFISMTYSWGLDSRYSRSSTHTAGNLGGRTVTSTRIEAPLLTSFPQLSVVLGMDSESGPLDKGLDMMADNRLRRSRGSFWAGAQWQPWLAVDLWVKPFFTAGMGLTLANFTSYEYSEAVTSAFHAFPSIHAEAGLIVIPEGLITLDEASYQFILLIGCDWTIGFNHWKPIFPGKEDALAIFTEAFIPRIGLGFRYGLDV